MKALTPTLIQESIDRASQGHSLQRELQNYYGSSSSLTFRHVTDKDWEYCLPPLFALKDQHQDSSSLLVTKFKTPWFFGIVLYEYKDKKNKKSENNNNDDKEEDDIAGNKKEVIVGLITFYVAYSTWNGRILYLDQIQLFPTDSKKNDNDANDNNNDNNSSHDGGRGSKENLVLTEDLEKLFLRILASIAVDLDFARLTWRHKDTPKWHKEGSNQPEMHGEVLTLSMDQEAMKHYVGGNNVTGTKESQTTTTLTTTTTTTTNPEKVIPFFSQEVLVSTIEECLALVNMASENNNNNAKHFRVRLAKVEQDLETIVQLVQGLADYVNESDSVKIGIDEYRLDGGFVSKEGVDSDAAAEASTITSTTTTSPVGNNDDSLFTCLLLDYIEDDTTTSTTTGKKIVHTCGYAVCYFGYNLLGSSCSGSNSGGAVGAGGDAGGGSGRFMYLEDLFLQVEYRQKGGGNFLMKTLAQICLSPSLQCQHLYWQALDWNTGGLEFYKKIGAKILHGEKTSRYCDDAMKLFAEHGTGV